MTHSDVTEDLANNKEKGEEIQQAQAGPAVTDQVLVPEPNFLFIHPTFILEDPDLLKCLLFFIETEGFFIPTLDVLYEGLEISKLQFFYKKKDIKKLQLGFFLVIKTLNPYPIQ